MSTVSMNETGTNETSAGGDYELLVRILDPMVWFIIWICTNVGTCIILFLFSKESNLREVSGCLMVTITCIDFAIAQVVILPSVYSSAALAMPWAGTILCVSQAALVMFLQNMKAMVIMLCALDRACSILFPFRYTKLATPRLFWAELIAIFAACTTMPTLLFGVLQWSAEGDPQSGMCFPAADESAMVFYWLFLLINAIAPGAVVVVCYSAIMTIVFRQRQTIFQQEQISQPASTSGGQTRNIGMTLLSNLRACKMLFVVTVIYFLVFLPIVIADHFFQDNVILYHVCNYLAFFNVATNFPIYYRMNKSFKNAYHKAFSRRGDDGLQLKTNTITLDC